MNEVLIELIQYMVAFGGVIALFFITFNFLTKGFLLTYLITKASRGAKVLMRIHSATDTYYKTGFWNEGFLVFKIRGKETKRIPMQNIQFKSYIHNELGISVIEIDEEGKLFVTKDMQVHHAINIDPGRTETLFLRIKNRPKPQSKQDLIVLILLGVIAVAVVVMFMMLKQWEPIIQNLATLTGNV